MGQKGDKHTPEAQLNAELLLEKLSVIEGVTSKKMFGGHGIFHEDKMFGMISAKGIAFLRTNDSNRDDYLNKGSEQHSKMPYHSIPDNVLNGDELLNWAKESIEISKF
jgi:DNA transformation protein and related proteins